MFKASSRCMKNQITCHILMNHKGTRRKKGEDFPQISPQFIIYRLPEIVMLAHLRFFPSLSSEKTLINFAPFITHDLGIKIIFIKKQRKLTVLCQRKSERIKKYLKEKNCFVFHTIEISRDEK